MGAGPVIPCPGCADPLEAGRACQWDLCPEFGMVAVRTRATLPGAAAMAHLDRMMALEAGRAYGDVLTIEIEHRSQE